MIRRTAVVPVRGRRVWAMQIGVTDCVRRLIEAPIPQHNVARVGTAQQLLQRAEAYMPADWYGKLPGADGAPIVERIVQLLQAGDERGARRLRPLAEAARALVPPPLSARRRIRWGDSGDDLDRDRLLSGSIDTAWRSATRDVALAPLPITIVTPWGGSCARSAEQLSWNTAAALAASDLLEDAGYATEILLVSRTVHHRDKGHDVYACLTLKDLGQPVNLPSLIAASSPAVFRSFGFACIWSSPLAVGGELGYPAPPLVDDLVALGICDPGTFVLPEAFNAPGAEVALQAMLRAVNNVATFGSAE